MFSSPIAGLTRYARKKAESFIDPKWVRGLTILGPIRIAISGWKGTV
jgi:hypothetical protein